MRFLPLLLAASVDAGAASAAMAAASSRRRLPLAVFSGEGVGGFMGGTSNVFAEGEEGDIGGHAGDQRRRQDHPGRVDGYRQGEVDDG